MAEDSIDRGIAAAFGPPSQPARESSLASMLLRLRAPVDPQSILHLAPAEGDEGVPLDAETSQRLVDPAGRYEVRGEIARGGVGIVYRSRDHGLGRDVAMKVLKDEYLDRPDVLARFIEEAQIGGQLQHPGIVPVYEVGLQSGERPYFAMMLVRGETLAVQLARRHSPDEDRGRLLAVFEQVCQTVAYAHARRVVHRDLKPANVMIGAFGEVRIVDWGFAKVLAPRSAREATNADPADASGEPITTLRSRGVAGSQSVAGTMFGTPAYMSPEQARGIVEQLDERSDVFGLGALLCEILSGGPPYLEADGDLVQQAATGALEGARARLERCGADPLLIELCRDCLSAERSERPASAAELAVRMRAWSNAVEDRARKAELRAAEARYRHRLTLGWAAAVLVLMFLGAAVFVWRQRDLQSRRMEAGQRVASAAAGARQARDRARSVQFDAGLWAAAEASVQQLMALTDSEDADDHARADANDLLLLIRRERDSAESQAIQRQRDASMLARLENLRIPLDDDVRSDGWQDKERRRLNAEYVAAFREYLHGASILDQPSQDSLLVLKVAPPDVRAELATSLDLWTLVRYALLDGDPRPDPAATARLHEVASSLDSDDPWRTRLREILPDAANQGPRLCDLAAQVGSTNSTSATYRVLSAALWSAGERDLAVRVLSLGQERHSQDFDLCFRLLLHVQMLESPDWGEVLSACRVAHALRPAHNEVLHRQGQALEFLGRFADAERVFLQLVEREPGNTHWLLHVGTVRGRQGKTDAALETYARAGGNLNLTHPAAEI